MVLKGRSSECQSRDNHSADDNNIETGVLNFHHHF